MDQSQFHNFDFFNAVLDSLPNPIFYKDKKGYYRYCNSAFVKFCGLKYDDIINKTVFDIAPPELSKIYDQGDQNVYTYESVQIYEAKLKHADGTLHDVIFRKVAHFNMQHEAIGLVGFIQDITEKKETQREVDMLHKLKDAFLYLSHVMPSYENEHQLLNALLVQVQSIFVKCTQASVLELNKNETLTILAQIGFHDKDMLDFKIPLKESFIFKDYKGEIVSAQIVNDIIAYTSQRHSEVALPISNKSIQSSLVVPIRINNHLKWIFTLDSTVNNVYTETDRKVADYIKEQLPLVYQLYELYLKTLNLSRYDALTKLINRQYFDTLHEKCYNHSLLQHKSYALVLFDLDGLKHVNDLYGHHAGDTYLVTFSNWLTETILDGHSYSRLGGDEFVGLFHDITVEALTEKINHLRKTFELLPIVEFPHVYFGSFSFGVSNFPEDSDNRSKLFQIADVRMYKDKRR
ncbi:GGDEF domain-containing protein [Fusibacter bizertensis]